MSKTRPIHSHFHHFLCFKEQELIATYQDLRAFVLSHAPQANELFYHTHALTSVYTFSEKMSDAFCMIPIYTKHLNLGFNKGTLLDDPHQLLQGTGKLIRHIPIANSGDYRNKKVEALIKSAMAFALEDQETNAATIGETISKIKRK